MAQSEGPVGKRRAFTAEFKLEAVRHLQECRATGVSLSQVARELGIQRDLLRGWARQVAERAGAAAPDIFPGPGRLPSEPAELRRLQREVTRLQQENEFLKKAAAYFAKDAR
jgi:transposase